MRMTTSKSSRPYMPGYGIQGADEGPGLLPWDWAEERLIASRNYWVSSLLPDGRPHMMPVWGVWHTGSFWFSSSKRSRKTRNLVADPRCTVAIEDALNPVIITGMAALITERESLVTFLAVLNGKYGTDYAIDFLDPLVNATLRVEPHWAFGLREDDFTGSPTRWVFDDRDS